MLETDTHSILSFWFYAFWLPVAVSIALIVIGKKIFFKRSFKKGFKDDSPTQREVAKEHDPKKEESPVSPPFVHFLAKLTGLLLAIGGVLILLYALPYALVGLLPFWEELGNVFYLIFFILPPLLLLGIPAGYFLTKSTKKLLSRNVEKESKADSLFLLIIAVFLISAIVYIASQVGMF